MDQFAPLISHVRKYVALDEQEAAVLSTYARHRQLKKKEFLLKEGQICTANYFVLKGCVRMYFIREDGVEQITQFAIENWWITDFQSLDWQQPSRFYIQSIESTALAVLDRDNISLVCDRLPQIDRYLRLVVQRAFAAAQQHRFFMQSDTSEERYLRFTTGFPQFIQRIPQYMVASYLGFTPEFISKLKGRRK
jgi:CRP-like cAMP-binding protein